MKRFLLAAAKAALMLVFIWSASMVGGALVALTRPAEASRDAAGAYTLPVNSENPAVFGTPISPSDHNATMNDIKAELTDSLSRSAKGAMLAQLKLFDGTVGTPGLGWGTETGTGLRRQAAGDIRFGVGGVDVGQWTANGYRSANGVVATPGLSFINDTGSGLYRIGSNDLGFAVNGTKISEWNTPTNGTAGFAVNSSTTGTNTGWAFAVKNADNYQLFVVPRVGATNFNTLTQAGDMILAFNQNGVPDTGGLVIGPHSTGGAGLRFSSTNVTVGGGVAVDGSGFKHQSVAGCTTAASVGATCSSTLSWGTAFADANYHVVCGCNGTTGVPVVASYTGIAASVGITTAALTAVAATCTNISCVAVHN